MRTYAVVIHEDPEGGFWGEVPALPGCYSQGETINELRDNIREALVGVLEVMRECSVRSRAPPTIPNPYGPAEQHYMS